MLAALFVYNVHRRQVMTEFFLSTILFLIQWVVGPLILFAWFIWSLLHLHSVSGWPALFASFLIATLFIIGKSSSLAHNVLPSPLIQLSSIQWMPLLFASAIGFLYMSILETSKNTPFLSIIAMAATSASLILFYLYLFDAPNRPLILFSAIGFSLGAILREL